MLSDKSMGIRKFWDFISNRHLSPHLGGLEYVKARVLNQYAFLLCIFFFVDAIKDLFDGFFLTSLFLFSLGIIILMLFFFTKARFRDSFVFSIVLFCSVLIFVFSSAKGFDNGLTFYYFGILLACIFLFNERKNYFYGLTLLLLVLTFFYIGHHYDFELFDIKMGESVEFARRTRIHTFLQLVVFTGFNAIFIITKNSEITRLYEQKERSDQIIMKLTRKLNDNSQSAQIERLVKLAMEDNVLFLPVFKEVFPDCYEALADINPNMTQEEFRFCAMLKLGFTTKEIASYTHLAIRSVQTKKNRLRKSFQIASDEDLYVWIDRIATKSSESSI